MFKVALNRSRMAVAGIAILLLLAGLTAIWLSFGRFTANIKPIPDTIVSSVSFPLYYPYKLPKAYTIDQNSFSATKEVVTFAINYGNGSRLIVSQQPIPPNFNFEEFYKKEMGNSASIITELGQARTGFLSGQKVASMTTSKTWILITAPNGIEDLALQDIMKSFSSLPSN